MHTKKVRGFTLIELLIVVSIIGILAAIAIPQVIHYKAKFVVAKILSKETLTEKEEKFYRNHRELVEELLAEKRGNNDQQQTEASIPGSQTADSALAAREKKEMDESEQQADNVSMVEETKPVQVTHDKPSSEAKEVKSEVKPVGNRPASTSEYLKKPLPPIPSIK